MNKAEIPFQVIPGLAQTYRQRISTRSQTIYITVIVALILAVASLPLLSVTINVKSSGHIRPVSEMGHIRSLVNGRIKESFVTENQFVHRGDIIYRIESEIMNEKSTILQTKIEDLEDLIYDLNMLLSATPSITALKTKLYRQSWYTFSERLNEANIRFVKAKADYERNLKLYEQDVIARAEFENYQFEFDKAKNNTEVIRQSQWNQWQNELRNFQKERADYHAQLAQLIKETEENLIIKAPVSGNVQNIAGIYPGSLVFVNQDLAQISPDTSLIVEAIVSPRDIGLLRKGMPARMQVDAFNYNQWGSAEGRILVISSDVHIVNDQPYFKVKCSLDRKYMELKNGYKGYLKKGMTMQVRFLVTERTLWQLLYDRMDDWMNPDAHVQETL